MEIARIIVGIVHIILSILIIALILLQSGKQAGLSGAVAGAGESFFGKNKGKSIPFAHTRCVESSLLQRNELRRVSSTNTGAVVLHGVVSKSELTQVVTNHLSLDFNVAEVVAVVHTDDATDHLGNNDHVTEVGLHGLRALVLTSSSLLKHQKQIQLLIEQRRTYSLLKSLQESHRLSLQTTAETTAGTSLQTRYIHSGRKNNYNQPTPISSIRSLGERSRSLSRSIPR